MARPWRAAALLFGAIVFSGALPGAAMNAGGDPVLIQDDAPYHAHPAGRPFILTIRVNRKAGRNVQARWQDFEGNVLGSEASLSADGQPHNLTSPSGKPGYYGLVVLPPPGEAWPGLQPGEAREFGFVVLAGPLQGGSAESPFGTVHADPADPYMPPWIKTATWMTASPEDWAGLIDATRKHGKIELPIITGRAWESDGAKPVPAAQLDDLEAAAKAYFETSDASVWWETGIEENLGDDYAKPYYWDNLLQKIVRLRRAAKSAGRTIRFIYQVAGTETPDIERFFQNPVSKEFDALSLHPYAWPSFPPPDLWLEDFLDRVKKLKAKYGAPHPVWFTEVGAPHFGNAPGRFFGYPEKNETTGGLSRKDAAAYVVKMCVIALSSGVEKVFWYNYRDAGPERELAESHFGLRDYWDYPKPAYAAYSTTIRRLHNVTPSGRLPLINGAISAYTFKGNQRRLVVAWAPPGHSVSLPLAALGIGPETTAVQAVNAVGHPASVDGGVLLVGDSPVFIEIKTATPRP